MLIWLISTSCDNQRKSMGDEMANEAMIMNTLKIYMDSCWNNGNIANLENISADGFIRNLNGITVASTQKEMQAHMAILLTGFPDLKVSLDSTYIKDNAIFTRWSSTGTHTGVFGEMGATGKKVNISGLSQLYFNTEGKLIQEDVVYNELELLQQLGYTLKPPVLE